jgi:PHD/YefM family antitoxin component YafN of YafNO toxin-antitoxin module
VRAGFAEAVNRANFAGERTLIRRHGKDVAAVVSVEDLKTLEALEDRLDLEEAREIMKKPGRLIPWEKVKADLGHACATPSPGPSPDEVHRDGGPPSPISGVRWTPSGSRNRTPPRGRGLESLCENLHL